MRIVSRLAEVATREAAVITIGQFDGVHRAHQRRVQRAVELAGAHHARAVVITFWPPPLAAVHPGVPPSLLSTQAERRARLAALGGLDLLAELPFTRDLTTQSGDEILAVLRRTFDLRALVVGSTYTAGGDRLTNLESLCQAAAAERIACETVEVRAGGEPIGSARIRTLISSGQVESAGELLGAPYWVSGTVVEGDRRGRQLGFPTANLRVDPIKLIPAHGVYAVRVALMGDPSARRAAVANVGVRPTFGAGNTPLVEVHLLDANVDLYGQPLQADFIARLRSEQRFTGLDALKAQIAADAAQARALLVESADALHATPDGAQGWPE